MIRVNFLYQIRQICCFLCATGWIWLPTASWADEVTVAQVSAEPLPWQRAEASTVVLPQLSPQQVVTAVESEDSGVTAGGASALPAVPVYDPNAEIRGTQQLLSQTQRRVFEIWGTEYNAIQSVTTLAQAIENVVGAYLPYIESFPQPIWIQVTRNPQATEPFFQIQVSSGSDMGLRVFWNGDTSAEFVAQGISWALLQRIAMWRWGQVDEGTVPHWLPWAVAQEAIASLQPARNHGLAAAVWENRDFLPLVQLIGARQGAGSWSATQMNAARLQALWFYRLLRDRISNRNQFGLLIEAFLSDRSGISVLQRAFGDDVKDPRRAQQWWEVGLMDVIHQQQGMVYSLAQSDRLLSALSGVTAWSNGRDERMSGPALWAVRDQERWQSALWYRQREVKIELQRINPVYFNALLSLARFYDLLLEKGGSDKDDLEELQAAVDAAYTDFVEDFAFARALRSAVDTAMGEAVRY